MCLWHLFERPKLIYQDITWQLSFNYDDAGTLSNNTVYFLPTEDHWVLSVLNSPAAWAYAWRKAQHGKDEALRYFNPFVESFPIPRPTDEQRSTVEELSRRLIAFAKTQHKTAVDVLHWLNVEHEIEKPSTNLFAFLSLDSEGFIAEVRKIRGKKKPLSSAGLRSLVEEHKNTIVPAQSLVAEAQTLERQISNLVNEAYGLTREEVNLMWETAPPRMPATPL